MTSDFRSGAARALVHLHERELRRFAATWRRARAAGVAPPPTEDPDCATLDALLRHVLACSRGYIVWCAGALGQPAPDIPPVPDAAALPARLDEVLEGLLTAWPGPLREVEGSALDRTEARSGWGVTYCVDAMLEHAVMHPLRHTHQLEGWMAGGR